LSCWSIHLSHLITELKISTSLFTYQMRIVPKRMWSRCPFLLHRFLLPQISWTFVANLGELEWVLVSTVFLFTFSIHFKRAQRRKQMFRLAGPGNYAVNIFKFGCAWKLNFRSTVWFLFCLFI